MSDFITLQADIGIEFRDLSLLRQALVHRSYIHENPDSSLNSNERLEFLGDAVLGFVIADEIYHRFPEMSEGELTKLRSAVVRAQMLDKIAAKLNLGDYLYLGRGEEETGGRSRPRKLGSALEALIGAVLIDRGFDTARGFILRILGDELERKIEHKIATDYKSRLQQVVQSKWKTVPTYRTIGTTGPDHAKIFTVEVSFGESILGQGSGKNKRSAEMRAAREALEKLERE